MARPPFQKTICYPIATAAAEQFKDQDPFLIPGFYTNYEDCFDDVRRVDLPGGHFIQDERPNDVAREMELFLSE